MVKLITPQMLNLKIVFTNSGAHEKTRTSTGRSSLAPQASASTNSATRAFQPIIANLRSFVNFAFCGLPVYYI